VPEEKYQAIMWKLGKTYENYIPFGHDKRSNKPNRDESISIPK
jgi:hypothetical protein